MAGRRTDPRPDITYLRRRPKRPEATAPSGGAAGATPAGGHISFDRPGRTHTPPAAAQPAAAAAAQTPATPPASGGLNLAPPGSAPTPPSTPTPAAPPASGGLNLTPPSATPAPGGLNLSAPAAAPEPAPAAPSSPPAAAPSGGALNLSPPAVEQPAPPSAPAAPASGGGGASALSLGGAAAPAARALPAKPPAKRVAGRVLLTADDPTVTLDRRQSAVGSLVFDIAGPGAIAAIWELGDGMAGVVDEKDGVHISPDYGRRPIVELAGGRIIVGLRHVRELRRLLILMNGFRAKDPQRLVATLHDEATFETAHTGSGPYVAALAIYQVDGELVVRREGFGFDSNDTIAAAYGFTRTWLPPVQRP